MQEISVCAANYHKFKNAQTFKNEEMQFQDDWKFSRFYKK